MDLGVGIGFEMSDEGQMSDDVNMAAVIECLERQTQVLKDDHEALLLLIRRTDGFGTELRGVSETLKTIVRRQSELEAESEQRRVTCADVMRSLSDRLTALEKDLTPAPRKFTDEELDKLYPPRIGRSFSGSNGGGDARLSLSATSADDAAVAIDENEEED